MKNLIVIGGSGYIGTTLIPLLLKKKFNIINIDNLIYGQKDENLIFCKKNKLSNYKHFKKDLRNIRNLKFEKKNLFGVIILGGLVGDPITKKYPLLSKKINREGIKNCIDFFKNEKLKLIFVSTCSNYGLRKKSEPAKETSNLKPLSLYAKDKVFIENYLKKNISKFKFDFTILRFATAFGLSPKMRFDLSISDFTHQMFFKKKITVYDPFTWRPYCHVKDFAKMILIVLNSKQKNVKNQIYNVGSDINNFTKKKIILEILKKIPKVSVKYLKNDIDPRNYKVNFSKVKNKLKFNQDYSVQFGIKELIKNFKRGKFKTVSKLGNYNIEK